MELTLEYLKVLLSTHVVMVVMAFVFIKIFKENIASLIDRIKVIEFPGGKVSTPQLEKMKDDVTIESNALPESQSANLPANIKENDIEAIKSLYAAERARSYFWEYSYLNFFLVQRTQLTLDWLASCPSPVSVLLYDTFTSPTVPAPKERKAILAALESHYLVLVENELISVTEKGHEYIEWRKKVHQSSVSNSL